ncbi:hypothetical protein RISK_005318 [Rhodopirellula islandica]|uniref:Uncharacterized protein n=1 Tax=Rhodopirellula islandica TaxID=595434 RepID=A0A0J1B680_RHOIS|nr:hypothetical protein [Rhodopirellula islandica]KLU02252.1 hypothetical protein RISK_005318 [Rhodopirellula islandica]
MVNQHQSPLEPEFPSGRLLSMRSHELLEAVRPLPFSDGKATFDLATVREYRNSRFCLAQALEAATDHCLFANSAALRFLADKA